jgi:autotransporter-associated beta strand protein
VTVTAGTLQIDAANAMADTAALRLPSASAVNLIMNANDTVGALYINGVQQPNGTYTSSGAGSGWMSGSGTLTVGAASVQPVYWDQNGSTPGAGGATPTGTWDASAYWNDAAGTGTAASWSAGRTAAFAAGTDATGSYTVTVSGSQDIGGLTFEEGDVTLSGGTELRLMSDAVAYVAPSRTATVATPLTQDVSGRALTKGGPGTLVLSAENTFSGATTLSAGTLRLASPNAIASSARLSMAGGVAVVETNVNLTALTVETIAGNTATISGGTLAFAPGGSITNKVEPGYGDTQPVLTISSAITGSPTVWAAAGTGSGPSYNWMKFAPTNGTVTLGKVSLGYADGNGGDKGWLWLSGTTTGNSVSEVADLGGYSSVKQDSGTWAYGNVPVSSLYLLGGNMILNGTVRTWYAGFILSGGTLHYNVPGAIDTSTRTFTISGGNLDNTSGAALTATNNPTTTWGGNWTFLGSNGTNSDLYIGTGAVTLSATSQVTVSNAVTTLTVGGVISGATFGLVKAGAGTLKLTGKNTYSGATTISNGTLQVVVGGSCSNSAVTVAASAGTLAISVTNTVPKWTCSNLTLNSGNLKFSFSVAPSFTDAPLSITNTVAFNGSTTIVVDPANLQSGKKYPLLTVGGTPPETVPAVSITGMSGILAWEGKTLYLNIPPAGTIISFF